MPKYSGLSLPALRHLILFSSGRNRALARRTFQLLLSNTNSDLHILPVGASISLSLTTTLSWRHLALTIARFVELGVLSTSVPINHLPTVDIMQITFSRFTGNQLTTHYKLSALEVEHRGHKPSGDILSLLGSDFATTLEHFHISRLATDPSEHHFMLFRGDSP